MQDKIEKIISENIDIINFGTKEDAVDSSWIKKAQKVLDKPLSASYKWFLENYAGGEIGGEEIYSIYGIEFEIVNGGDIVYHYLLNKKSKIFNSDQLEICSTDLGESFFFNYSEFKNEECPIYVRLPSGNNELYASNFYEFIIKRISAHKS
jgi:hypothetical protein